MLDFAVRNREQVVMRGHVHAVVGNIWIDVAVLLYSFVEHAEAVER